jgi:hypothetical protein
MTLLGTTLLALMAEIGDLLATTGDAHGAGTTAMAAHPAAVAAPGRCVGSRKDREAENGGSGESEECSAFH